MSASGNELDGPRSSAVPAAAAVATGSASAAVGAAPPAASASAAAPVTPQTPSRANGGSDGVAGASTPEPLLSGIARLKAEQANLRAERKRVAKELKNAEKRRTKLKKRARQLSDKDLVAVLQMRQTTPAPGSTTDGNADGDRGESMAASPARQTAGV